MSYSVYVGETDCGFIIADSIYEAEQRAYDLYPDNDKDDITVSFLDIESEDWF